MTDLDFSQKVDRDWAFEQCVGEDHSPSLITLSTECGSSNINDQRLHLEFALYLASLQRSFNKHFIVAHESDDTGNLPSSRFSKICSYDDVDYLPIVVTTRGVFSRRKNFAA